MASSRLQSTSPSSSQSAKLTARELVDKYSGMGLQFRVKFVGSENINRSRGDAEAARYCMPTLRVASKNKRNKPRFVLGLNLRGLAFFNEGSKTVIRIPIDKVTYVSHDPEDICYVAIIVHDKKSHTGFRLYCFKAEKIIANNLVASSRELFNLIFKLREAKRKLKEENEAAANQQNTDPDTTNLPEENAPPPSYLSVTAGGPPPSPPMQKAPAVPPHRSNNTLFSFDDKPQSSSITEEYDTFKGIHTNNTPNMQTEYMTFLSAPPSGRSRPQGSSQPPPPSHPPPSISDNLSDVFMGLPPAPGSNPFGQPQPLPVSNPPPPQAFPPNPQEPSITIDLVDAIRNPQPGTMSSYPMGMGMRSGMGMGPGIGMGSGMGMGMGQPFPGQYNNQFSGFPTGQPTSPFGNTNAPQQDVFSLPADPLLDSTFSQPLLPANPFPAQQPQQQQKQTGRADAFSDLVSLARNKTSNAAKGNESMDGPPPPLPPRPPDLGKEKSMSSGMMLAFEDEFKGQQQPLTTSVQSSGGFDAFGDNFTTQSPPPATAPSGNSWTSFMD